MNRIDSHRMDDSPLAGMLQPKTVVSPVKCWTDADQMRFGKQLILAGFAIAISGVIAYLWVTLSIPPSESPEVELVTLSLGVTALGFFSWLVGAIRYFSAAINAGEDMENLL